MLRFTAFCFLSIFALSAWAQAPMVVSTHPIYLIAKEVTQGVEQPKLLLENQTGHDIQMTPAHRKMIQDASLVIWLGQAHEAPLANVLSTHKNAVAILDIGIIQTLPMRNARGVALKNTVDTHVWLDPNNAVRIGFFMAALRSQQIPENKEVYWSNARKFAQKMLLSSQQIKNSVQSQPYWALHDAYQYLERPLMLRFAGSLTEDTHMAPTIAQIKYLKDTRPQSKMCLLAEAGASSSQYNKLGNIIFEAVDESFTGQQDFVKAWLNLAKKAQICIRNSQK